MAPRGRRLQKLLIMVAKILLETYPLPLRMNCQRYDLCLWHPSLLKLVRLTTTLRLSTNKSRKLTKMIDKQIMEPMLKVAWMSMLWLDLVEGGRTVRVMAVASCEAMKAKRLSLRKLEPATVDVFPGM